MEFQRNLKKMLSVFQGSFVPACISSKLPEQKEGLLVQKDFG